MQRRARRQTEKVDYARLNGDGSDEDDEVKPDYRRHLHILINSSKFHKDGHQTVAAGDLTLEWLANGNFKLPTLVPKSSGSLEQLGLRLPSTGSSKQISLKHFIKEIGLESEVHTIDVASQKAGPRWSLHQWEQYWTVRRSISAKSKKNKAPKLKKGRNVGSVDDEAESSRIKIGNAPPADARAAENPTAGDAAVHSATIARSVGTGILKKGISNDSRRRILELVALPLAETSLGSAISQPRLVCESDLTEKVCPPGWEGRRDLGIDSGLVANLSPTGAYSDFKFAPSGAAIWLHVMTGKKVLCCAPPSKENMAAYLAWMQHPIRSQIFFGAVAEGVVQLEVHAGDTVLIPSGWMMAQAAVDDSMVIGSTFSHAEAIGAQLSTVALDRALQVPPLPALKELLWYVAKHLSLGLETCLGADVVTRTAGDMPTRARAEAEAQGYTADLAPQPGEATVPRRQRTTASGMKRRAIIFDEDEDGVDADPLGLDAPVHPLADSHQEAGNNALAFGAASASAAATQLEGSAHPKRVKLKIATPPLSPLSPVRRRESSHSSCRVDTAGRKGAPAILESRPAGIKLKVSGRVAVAVPSLPKATPAPLPPVGQSQTSSKLKVKVKLPAMQNPASESPTPSLPSLKFKLNPSAVSASQPNDTRHAYSPAVGDPVEPFVAGGSPGNNSAKSARGELPEFPATSKTRIRLRPPAARPSKDGEAAPTIPQVDGADDEVFESETSQMPEGFADAGAPAGGGAVEYTLSERRRSDSATRAADCLSAGSGMRPTPAWLNPSVHARGSAMWATSARQRPPGLKLETPGASPAEDVAPSATSRAGSGILGLPGVFGAVQPEDTATGQAELRRPGEGSSALGPGTSQAPLATIAGRKAPAWPQHSPRQQLEPGDDHTAMNRAEGSAEAAGSPETMTGSIQMSYPQPSTGECPDWPPPRADTAQSSGHPHDIDDCGQPVDQPPSAPDADAPGTDPRATRAPDGAAASLQKRERSPSSSRPPARAVLDKEATVPPAAVEAGGLARSPSVAGVKLRRGGSNSAMYYETAPQGEVLIPLGRNRHLAKSKSLAKAAGLAARATQGPFQKPTASQRTEGVGRQGSRVVEPSQTKGHEPRGAAEAAGVPKQETVPELLPPPEAVESLHEGSMREAGGSETVVSMEDDPTATSGPAKTGHTDAKEASAKAQPDVPGKRDSFEYKVYVSNLQGERLGSWRVADVVALLCALETWCHDGEASAPKDIRDPEAILKALEAGLRAAGVDVDGMIEDAPMRWHLGASPPETYEMAFHHAVIQERLPSWPIYDDAEAMEHAATSTPEAIVGSPRAEADGPYMLTDGEWEEEKVAKAKRSKLHPPIGSRPAGAQRVSATPGSAATRKPPQKQSKMSVHERLRKKLRMK